MPKNVVKGESWRVNGPSQAAPSKTKAKKWSSVTISSLLLLVVGGGTISLIAYLMIRPTPRPYFAPFWVGGFAQNEFSPDAKVPTVPWMRADRAALKDGDYFPGLDPLGFVNPTKEVMQAGLKALQKRDPWEAVVVYLATYGLVDAKGVVQVLGRDSDPDSAETMLPLGEVLEDFAACPSKTKLLVLDVARPLNLPGPVGLGDAVSGRLADEVKAWQAKAKKGKSRPGMVLVSSSPGQRSLGSETLGESAFNHFFRRGLAGEADTSRNKRVSARELAEYLKRTVDGWAITNLGVHQEPALLTSGDDFDLIEVKTPKTTPTPPAPVLARKDPAKEKAKEKEKDAGKGKEPEPPAGAEYPKWLAEGWDQRAAWSRRNDLLTAPRAFRKLEDALLKAEHDWRGGGDPAEIRRQFEILLVAVRAELKESRPDPPKPFRSVGQAVEFGGWGADPALVAELGRLIGANRKQLPTLKTAVPAYLAGFKEKPEPGLELAGTIVAATKDDRPDAATVSFLNRLLLDSGLGHDQLVETRFLHDLAERLERGTTPTDPAELDARDEAIRQAWGVITLAEQANNRPDALVWVRDVLDEAEASRDQGEVLLRANTAGYATWEKIAAVWKEAREGDGYALVSNTQETIRHAQAAVCRAMDVLPAYLPYLDAVVRTDLEDGWFKAAQATQDLLPMLQPPRSGPDGRVALSAETLRARGGEVRAATEALEERLNDLQRPFDKEEVAALVKRSEADKADPEVVREIDAALLTPFLNSADRVALWTSGRLLAQRLAALPLPPRPEEVPAAARSAGDGPEVALRRAARLATLLALAGEDVATLREKLDRSDARGVAGREKERPEIVRQLVKAWSDLLAELKKSTLDDDLDRPGSIAPAFADWRNNPIRERLRREAVAQRSWLVEHYLHAGRDLTDPDKFYQAAAIEAAAGEPPPEVFPAFRIDGPETTDPLTAEHPRTNRTLLVELHDPNAAQAEVVELKVITPGDNRLVIKPETITVKPTRAKPAPATFQVAWNEGDRVARGAPAGFLVEARLRNKRNYHVRVPLNILRNEERLRLVLSNDSKKATNLSFEGLRLRTLAERQSFYLYVYNPSPAARDVRVEILKGEPPDLELVASAKVAARSGPPVKVSGFDPPPLKSDAALPELEGALTFRIIDEKTQVVLDERRLPVDIASAADLVGDVKALYVPPQPDGEANKVSVTLLPGPELDGKCPVELVLSGKFIPRLAGPPAGAAVLSGPLAPGVPLELFANDIPLNFSERDERGHIQLDIDGQKRALWYFANFTPRGAMQRLQEDRTPRVRVSAEPRREAGKPTRLVVDFEVDYPPPDGKLKFVMVQAGLRAGGQPIISWPARAKDRHLGFDARGENGALQFEARLSDWHQEFDVPKLQGHYTIEATLLDKNNLPVAATPKQPLDVDNVPPGDITFLELDGNVPKGTPKLTVRARVKVPDSGIKLAEFIIGPQSEFAKATPVEGHPVDGDPGTWEAILDASKAAGNPVIVSVRFTSNAGLVGFKTRPFRLYEAPAPTPPVPGEGADKPTVGSIMGKVMQVELPQPGLTVYLEEITAQGRKYDGVNTTTGADGSYSFKDLKPGKYRISAANKAYGTQGEAPATVVAGKKPAEVTIDLIK